MEVAEGASWEKQGVEGAGAAAEKGPGALGK